MISFREEACLYTLTTDSVLRVFKPVIDAPNRLQLHASLDRWSFIPDYLQLTEDEDSDQESFQPQPIFSLDRDVLCKTLPLSHYDEDDAFMSEVDQGRMRKLKELAEEDWELFGYILKDGSLVVRALAVNQLFDPRI